MKLNSRLIIRILLISALLLISIIPLSSCVPTQPPANGSQPPAELQWTDYMIFVFIVLVLVWGIWRRRRQGSTRLQIAIGLLSDMKHDQKVIDAYQKNPRAVKKFKAGNWKKHQDKLEFLDPAVQANLKETFGMVADLNSQIETAIKNKAPIYLSGLPVEKLVEPLARSRQGLVEWVQANLQTELYSRRRGFFG